MSIHARNNSSFKYRVAILGAPSRPDVPWSVENVKKLKDLGFNAVQLNIAWGGRPMDEALNLEDVVSLSERRLNELNQPDIPLRSMPERREERRRQLHDRLRISSELGMRTIFHFGAPYNSQYGGIDFEGPQARSLLDPETTLYYQELLSAFAEEYKEIDDILLYTFDQDAWLTSEFGSCTKTRGIPLHERVVPFIEALAKTWRSFRPDGWLWWSPWELSGGQVFQCLENISEPGIGVDLHSSVGEVIASMPVDRWLKNTVKLAAQKEIPVMVESFLGAVCEETEPFQHLAHPPLMIRQVQAIAAVSGVTALKEYYGLVPDQYDPNLEASALCMMQPDRSEESILQEIAEPYPDQSIIEFWMLMAQAHELFPWDVSWWIRCLGMADVSHDLNAATVRGRSCATPSWCSTRSATFIKTDDVPPHPWLLECVQLRCAQAAKLMGSALDLGRQIKLEQSSGLQQAFARTLRETEMLQEKVLSYVYHLRETNLAKVMRDFLAEGGEIPERIRTEMDQLLAADQKNQQAAEARIELPLTGAFWIWAQGMGSEEWNTFSPCCFRFTVPVRKGVLLKEAQLCSASSENLLRVQLNGVPLDGYGGGVPPYVASLKLHEGDNLIDVEVVRAGSLYNREGFCARIAVRYEDGSEDVFDTGAGWLARPFGQEEWSAAEVNAEYILEDYRHENRSEKIPARFSHARQGDGGEEVGKALELFRGDISQFLETYFLPVEDHRTRGYFSVTSC